MNGGGVVLALLLGFAIFGYLRARSSVPENARLPLSSWLIGTAVVFGVLGFLFFAARPAFGAILGGVVLAMALYAMYRLRHAS